MSEDDHPSIESGRPYWDDRIEKAFVPYDVDDETVALVTVWHRDEVDSLLETGSLVAVDERDRTSAILEDVDSFRIPDEGTLERLRRADRDDE